MKIGNLWFDHKKCFDHKNNLYEKYEAYILKTGKFKNQVLPCLFWGSGSDDQQLIFLGLA